MGQVHAAARGGAAAQHGQSRRGLLAAQPKQQNSNKNTNPQAHLRADDDQAVQQVNRDAVRRQHVGAPHLRGAREEGSSSQRSAGRRGAPEGGTQPHARRAAACGCSAVDTRRTSHMPRLVASTTTGARLDSRARLRYVKHSMSSMWTWMGGWFGGIEGLGGRLLTSGLKHLA